MWKEQCDVVNVEKSDFLISWNVCIIIIFLLVALVVTIFNVGNIIREIGTRAGNICSKILDKDFSAIMDPYETKERSPFLDLFHLL